MTYDAPAVRLFRSLLWLYPAEFREHFGQEICLAFRDRLREGNSLPAVASMYWQVLVDGPREHCHVIRQDITYALRTMRREKLSSLVAILVLGLAIGATTTVFSLVNGMLLRPLPYPQQESLMYVEEFKAGGLNGAVAIPNFRDFRERNHSVSEIALFGSGLATLRGDFEAERIPGASGSGGLFTVLGVKPLMGRTFTEEDTRENAPGVVVIGEDLWRRRFGSDPNILSKSIDVGSTSSRIIGVMPRGFHFPDVAELWAPLTLGPNRGQRADHSLEAVARLRPGVSPEQAQTDLRAIMEQITREHPNETYRQTVNVAPYRTRTTQRIQPMLSALLIAVGFVMLIACSNITNLLLAKGSVRAREIAVRGALGASRSRLVRQFVVESVLLGIAGAGFGMLLAWAAIPALLSLVPPRMMPAWMVFTPDFRILGFVAVVAVGSGILAGMAPAWSASRLNLVETLKEGGRSSTPGSARAWFRSALVVAEVAMSMLLLTGAGLMIRTFQNLAHQNTGYRADNLTTFQTSAPATRYKGREAAFQLNSRILEELVSIPGVTAVAGSSGVAVADRWGRSLTVENRPYLSLKDAPVINHTVVTPGYFAAMGIPLLAGRDFTNADTADSRVTIVDATLARRYWPNESPLGKRVRFGPPEDNEPWNTIVGVAGQAHNESLRQDRRDSVYIPTGTMPFGSLAYLVRSSQSAGLEKLIRTRVASIDRSVAVSRVLTMRTILDQSIWQERFFATLMTAFAALALVLAVVGLYGVMSYSVSRRSHEMGIRMALGASAAKIRRMILLQSGALVAIGLLTGATAAIFLTRLLESQLYGVNPGDPATLFTVAGLLAVSAMLASYIPARRATRLDPMLALREQ